MKNAFFTERQQHLVIVRSRIRRLNFMLSTAERVKLIRLYGTYGILGPFRVSLSNLMLLVFCFVNIS